MSKRYIATAQHAIDRPLVYAVTQLDIDLGWWAVYQGLDYLNRFDNHAEALAFAIAESGQ